MDTTTSTTITFDCAPVWISASPNLDHPVFMENPERVRGVEAALNYLGNKGHDIVEMYGRDMMMFIYKY